MLARLDVRLLPAGEPVLRQSWLQADTVCSQAPTKGAASRVEG